MMSQIVQGTNEEETLRMLDASIDMAFSRHESWIQHYFAENLMRFKWMRAAILQGSR